MIGQRGQQRLYGLALVLLVAGLVGCGEAATPTTGKVDIRVVTPERPDGGGTLP